jgi:four helix bundle protein
LAKKKAMDIAVVVYEVSTLLPNDEKFNLIHQIKKCVFPSNIAEGSGRNYDICAIFRNCKWVNF